MVVETSVNSNNNFYTLVGKLDLPKTQVVIASNPYKGFFFPKYVRDLRPETENGNDGIRGTSLLLNVQGLDSLESALSNDELPWDIRTPPILIEQVLNYFSSPEGYDEAFDALRNGSVKNQKDEAIKESIMKLLHFAEREGPVWGLVSKAESGKLKPKEIDQAAGIIYRGMLKPKGGSKNMQYELVDLIKGKPVGKRTLDFLVGIDPIFSSLGPGIEEQYVSFVQRAAVKALVAISDPEFVADVEYEGKLVSEEEMYKVRNVFRRLLGNYGVAVVVEGDIAQKLEPVPAVTLAEINTLPAEIKAKYKPLETMVQDMVIMMREMYNSILQHAKRHYPNTAEQIARLTMITILPNHEYFKQLYPLIVGRKDAQNIDLLERNREVNVQAANDIIRRINEGEIQVATPELEPAVSLLNVRNNVTFLADNLPFEMLDWTYLNNYLTLQLNLAGATTKRQRSEISALRQPYEEALINTQGILARDFGIDMSKVPFYQQFKGKAVRETMMAYFGRN